ncbi:MAG TPA: hypothetical protein VF939_14525 [Puia sp.]
MDFSTLQLSASLRLSAREAEVSRVSERDFRSPGSAGFSISPSERGGTGPAGARV